MEAFRTFSSDLLDVILNDPSIRPTIETKVKGRLDSSVIVNDLRNVVIVGHPGAFIFAELEPGRFIAHVAILQRYRGRAALGLGKAAFHQLWTLYGCLTCVAQAPLALPQVSVFAKKLGFRSLGPDPVRCVEHLIKETL